MSITPKTITTDSYRYEEIYPSFKAATDEKAKTARINGAFLNNLADARVVLVLTGAGIKYDPPPLPPAVDLTGADEEIVAAVRRALGV